MHLGRGCDMLGWLKTTCRHKPMHKPQPRMERQRKPRKCPACGHAPVAEILYGYPGFPLIDNEDLDSGRITLGGCVVTGDDPEWECTQCGQKIYKALPSFNPEPE